MFRSAELINNQSWSIILANRRESSCQKHEAPETPCTMTRQRRQLPATRPILHFEDTPANSWTCFSVFQPVENSASGMYPAKLANKRKYKCNYYYPKHRKFHSMLSSIDFRKFNNSSESIVVRFCRYFDRRIENTVQVEND